jgi:hypothetical protein
MLIHWREAPRCNLLAQHMLLMYCQSTLQCQLQPLTQALAAQLADLAELSHGCWLLPGFRMSRAKMGDLIKAGDVRVNWRPASKPALELKAGDLVSCTGGQQGGREK